VSCVRPQKVWRLVSMPGPSSDSSPGVPGILFFGIHLSFTTQGSSKWARFGPDSRPKWQISARNRAPFRALLADSTGASDALRAVLQ
jgi:hypothetical protein